MCIGERFCTEKIRVSIDKQNTTNNLKPMYRDFVVCVNFIEYTKVNFRYILFYLFI